MLHRLMTHFFGYGANTPDIAKLSLKTKNTHYKRGESVSGEIHIFPLKSFQIYQDSINISLKWKSLGKDEWLRDLFQDNHIQLPKQTREHPQVFNKGIPVFLNFSLKTEEYFNTLLLQEYIKQMYQDNKISWDQRSLQELIESLETLSRHLQCVVSNTVKILPLQIDESVMKEIIKRLENEKNKMNNRL